MARPSTRQLFDAIDEALGELYHAAAREAELCDLGGEPAPHGDIRRHLGSLIGRAKRVHESIGALAEHQHEWGEDDYCLWCGADGRA